MRKPQLSKTPHHAHRADSHIDNWPPFKAGADIEDGKIDRRSGSVIILDDPPAIIAMAWYQMSQRIPNCVINAMRRSMSKVIEESRVTWRWLPRTSRRCRGR